MWWVVGGGGLKSFSSVQTFRAHGRVSVLNSVPYLVLLLHWMMVAKKKTVGDLENIVESLQDKVEHLVLKVKNIEALEKKIKHLEDELNEYKSNTGKESECDKSKKVQARAKCSKCEGMFATKKMLKDHMKAYHFRDINCSDWDSTYDEQWKFEKHISTEHGKEKTFDCDNCDKSFYTMWRLRKHEQCHDNQKYKILPLFQ